MGRYGNRPLCIQFIFGRYGYLPYMGVCNMKNFLSKLIEKHAKLNEVELAKH
jgi:hypothetical protein